MFQRCALLVFTLLAAGLVHASDYTEPAMAPPPAAPGPDLSGGSQFLYQAPAGSKDLTPHVSLLSTVTKYENNNLKRYDGFFPGGVGAEFGINQMFAVGLDLTYQAGGSTYKCDGTCPDNTRTNGLMDPTLSFKGRNGVGSGTLRYGADLSVGVEKAKTVSGGTNNAASGGTTLTPWVGYENQVGNGFVGGKIQYDLYKGDRKVQNDTAAGTTTADPANGAPGATSTNSNGQNLGLNVFYEMTFKTKYTAGVNVNYFYHSESRTSVNGASSTPVRDQASATGLKFYGTIQFTDRIALLPQVGFEVLRFSNSNVVDGAVTLGAGCAGRFTF